MSFDEAACWGVLVQTLNCLAFVHDKKNEVRVGVKARARVRVRIRVRVRVRVRVRIRVGVEG